jgi:hypothetical protein
MRPMVFPFNKVRIVATLVGLGLISPSTFLVPARQLSLSGRQFTLSGRGVLGLILVGLTWTGVQDIMRDRRDTHEQPQRSVPLYWILPTALTAAAWASMPRLDTTEGALVLAAATGVGLALLTACEYCLVHSSGHRRAMSLFALRLSAYPLATFLYVAIPTATALAGAAVVALASAALSLRLICDDRCSVRRSWPMAVGFGAVQGVLSLAMNAWSATPLQHSLALVVLLYTLTGLARHWLPGRLTRRVLAEYVVVGLAAFALLFSFAR